jgi:hypothetical protein
MSDKNSVIISSNIVCLRELQHNDRERIAEIAREAAIYSTSILFGEYLNDKEKEKKKMSICDPSLEHLIPYFEEITKQMSKPISSNERVKILKNYISTRIPEQNLFFAYGPLQTPLDKSSEEYIRNAITWREMPKREAFRMGIEYEGKLIGCCVFDFLEPTSITSEHKITGDLGILVHPDYRILEKNDRRTKCWCEAFFAMAAFIQQIFPLYYPDDTDMYIYVTTHPCNRETKNILANGFTPLGEINNINYGSRKLFEIKYGDFLHYFLQNTGSRYCNVQSTWVKVKGFLWAVYDK